MTVKIENDNFLVEISSKGAEIQKFIKKDTNKNVIWRGDEKIWKNHAPILFPFVARCLGGYFLIEGKKCEYSKNHGFARDLEHKLLSQSKEEAIFELTQSDETLYRFPYKFSLITEYNLTKNGLDWKITVKNTDSKKFSFGAGTHAAFDLCGNKAEDFCVEFQKKEVLTSVVCTPEGYIAIDANNKIITKPYGEKEKGIIPITKEGFGNGHLFTNFSSEWVALRNLKTNEVTKISTKGFPYCMIWQNTSGDAQFVCIEPWQGIPDVENTNHIWEEKPGQLILKPGEEFSMVQDITV